MSNQPEALRLADLLDAGENFYGESSLWYDRNLSDTVDAAAAELRRLYEVNQELLEAAKLVIAWYEAEDDHSKADFYQRLEMCRTSEAALRAAIAKAEGA